MLPITFFADSNTIRPLMLNAVLSTFGVLGTTITAAYGAVIDNFNSVGNRCCSANNEIFCFNSVGDMFRMTTTSVLNKVLNKCSSRPVLLRNAGCTMDRNYVYVVNGVAPGLLGAASNTFHRYNIKDNTWSTLPVAPFSTSTSEIAINYDSNDYIYYTQGSAFYRYNISTSVWSSISTGHGLLLGTHSLVYYNYKLYLVSGITLKCYDINTSTWSTLASLPLLSSGARMFRYREYLYCFGGLTGILQYSIKENIWKQVQSTLLAVGDMCGGVIGSSSYIFLGNTVYGFK